MTFTPIDPVVVVANATTYLRDQVNAAFAERILDPDSLKGATKVWYLLRALNMPDITAVQKAQIYQCLIAFTTNY